MMLTILAAVLGFITIAGVGFVFAGPSGGTKVKRAAQIASPKEAKARARTAAGADSRRKQILKTLKDQDRAQKKALLSISAKLQQAGLGASSLQFWMVSAAIGVIVGFVPLIMGANPLIALGFAFVAGLGLPRWVVGFLAARRVKKFTEGFSDAMDVIVRGIRSGLPVHDCLKIIAREAGQPVAGEFQRLVENLSVGMSMEQALEKMFERMPTSELRFFSIVMAIQSKTGGNLAEALAGLSTVIRARKLMREKIKALSSEATASAMIIGALPPGVVVLISITSPAYMVPMFTDSRGHLMLLFSGIWMAMGVFVMRRMINFKF